MDLTKLSKKQLHLLKICYYGILHSTDELIDKATYKNIDIEETADVPQSIQEIKIVNTSISTHLELNGKDCTDPNIEW